MIHLGKVAVATTGLFVVANTIALVQYPIMMLEFTTPGAFGGRIPFVLSALAVAAYFVFGLYLIGRRDQIAEALFGETPATPGATPDQFFRVGVVVVGLWTIGAALPKTAKPILTAVFATVQAQATSSVMDPSGNPWMLGAAVSLPGLVAELLQVGFGLFLVGRSKWISNRLWRDEETK